MKLRKYLNRQYLYPYFLACFLLQFPLQLLAKDLSDEVINFATVFIGTKEEKGYNRGKYVDEFNRTAGVPIGSSWCMAFVYYIFDNVYKNNGLKNPLYRTASVAMQLKKMKEFGNVSKVINLKNLGAELLIKKGDIFCHKTGRQKGSDIGNLWLGHTGIFTGVISNKNYVTIEGNTSNGKRGSQRDGNGVYRRTRHISYWLAAIKVKK